MITDDCQDNNKRDYAFNQGGGVDDDVTHTCTCATGFRKEVTDASTDPVIVDDNKCVDIDKYQSNP